MSRPPASPLFWRATCRCGQHLLFEGDSLACACGCPCRARAVVLVRAALVQVPSVVRCLYLRPVGEPHSRTSSGQPGPRDLESSPLSGRVRAPAVGTALIGELRPNSVPQERHRHRVGVSVISSMAPSRPFPSVRVEANLSSRPPRGGPGPRPRSPGARLLIRGSRAVSASTCRPRLLHRHFVHAALPGSVKSDARQWGVADQQVADCGCRRTRS